MRSMTFVPVGPDVKRASCDLRKGVALAFLMALSAEPSFENVSPSINAPAAFVGPSVPSVPATNIVILFSL